jgi:hypothetical protein
MLDFDERDRVAAALYRHFQERGNFSVGRNFASRDGTFEDANQFTRTAFQDAVEVVLKEVFGDKK